MDLTKAVPKDNTKIIAKVAISNTSSEVVQVAAREANISKWVSRINSNILVRDKADTKCQCQDNRRRARVTKACTLVTSQLLASQVVEQIKKWFTRQKSQNKTSSTIMEERWWLI